MEYLFVYGTLLKNSGHPMAELIKSAGKPVGKAVFNGQLFMVDYYPGAVPSTEKTDRVQGEVYEFEQPDHVFKLLDDYEEFDPNSPATSEFIRKKVTVQLLKNRRSIRVWAYLFNHPVQELQPIETGNFEHFLRQKSIA